MKNQKKNGIFIIASLILTLTIIVVMLVLNVFASEEEDAMKDIEKAFSAYRVGETQGLTTDGYIGIPIEITTYYDYDTFGPAKAGYIGTDIALYFVNTQAERVGRESDVNIIS